MVLSRSGTRDGQTVVVREGGMAVAYSWSEQRFLSSIPPHLTCSNHSCWSCCYSPATHVFVELLIMLTMELRQDGALLCIVEIVMVEVRDCHYCGHPGTSGKSWVKLLAVLKTPCLCPTSSTIMFRGTTYLMSTLPMAPL